LKSIEVFEKNVEGITRGIKTNSVLFLVEVVLTPDGLYMRLGAKNGIAQ